MAGAPPAAHAFGSRGHCADVGKRPSWPERTGGTAVEVRVAHIEPAIALATCEQALRRLVVAASCLMTAPTGSRSGPHHRRPPPPRRRGVGRCRLTTALSLSPPGARRDRAHERAASRCATSTAAARQSASRPSRAAPAGRANGSTSGPSCAPRSSACARVIRPPPRACPMPACREASRRQRNTTLLAENRRLRDQIAELKTELAIAYGIALVWPSA